MAETTPNQEFELRVRWVMHQTGLSRETATDAVRNADLQLAAQCSGLPGPWAFGSRPATDCVGEFEAAVQAKIHAGETEYRARVLVKAETPGLHKAYCGCLGTARYSAEHACRVSREKHPTWLEWVEHCNATPAADSH